MVELVKVTGCTSCGSTDIRCNRKYDRSIRILHGVEIVAVTQQGCQNCKKTFTDSIEGAKHGARIADEVKETAADFYESRSGRSENGDGQIRVRIQAVAI